MEVRRRALRISQKIQKMLFQDVFLLFIVILLYCLGFKHRRMSRWRLYETRRVEPDDIACFEDDRKENQWSTAQDTGYRIPNRIPDTGYHDTGYRIP